MAKFKSITQKEFDNIKLLQQAGLSIAKVQRVTARSYGTVSRVFNSKALEDYKSISKPPTAVSPHIQEFTKILKSIDERLKFIEENAQVNHRRFFK